MASPLGSLAFVCSRRAGEPLWVLDEVSYRLAPLPVVGLDASRAEIDASPAVRLFRERAGARTQALLDTDRAGRPLGEICRRVDGLLLAIELTAARVAGLDLEDISLHLDDLFDLLPQSARRADGAQRPLRATVEWSDVLLAGGSGTSCGGWQCSPAGSTSRRSRRSAGATVRPRRGSQTSLPGSSRSRSC
jgi:predicted ATPase